jgi:hypothetical protein
VRRSAHGARQRQRDATRTTTKNEEHTHGVLLLLHGGSHRTLLDNLRANSVLDGLHGIDHLGNLACSSGGRRNANMSPQPRAR